MKTVRSLLIACLALGFSTAVMTTGCAERPGKKKEAKDGKDEEKKDEKKAGGKKSE